MRIGLLEDETAQAEMLKNWLQEAGHTCSVFATAHAFVRAFRRESFDLLIIDWELPDSSGIEVLGEIRSYADWPVPVLFATSRVREDDIVQALQAGADDYMSKPLRRREVLARIDALGRRVGLVQDDKQPYDIGPFRLEPQNQRIYRFGQAIVLTDKEFDLAHMLFSNIGRLLSRNHLLQTVWGLDDSINTRTLDTHVSSLRRKLDIRPEIGLRIKTVYRHGYRLEQVAEEP